MDISEILAAKKPQTVTVNLLLDSALQEERDRLIVKIGRQSAQESWDGGDMSTSVAALRQQREELEARIADAVVPFTFQAIPRKEWNALVELYDAEIDVPDEFFQAIVVASSVEPKIGEADAVEMWDLWSVAETDKLAMAAWKVNREIRDIPFTGADTETMSSIGSKQIIADPEDLPVQSF